MRASSRTGTASADVLELADIDRPVARRNEVLMQIQAAGLLGSDWYA